MAIASIAARTVDVDAMHLLILERKHRGQLLPQVVRRLRRAPTGEMIAVELRDRAGRTDRAMRVDRGIISGPEALPRVTQCPGGVTGIAGDIIFENLGVANVFPQFDS